MDDGQLAVTLLERFTARLPVVIRDVESAMAASDWSAAAAKAHRLRGEAANLSAIDLQAQATRLEAALRAGSLDEAAGCLPALQSAADAFVRSLPLALAQIHTSCCEATSRS
jgi:HPt (histidine-containing phosphotransfer) domain-containing protein